MRAGTATSDLGRERMEQGEKLLVGALGVDESAESEEWALREGMRLGGGGGGRNGGGLPSVGEFGETDETSSSRLSAPPARERQDTQSDAASTRSGSTVPAAGVERSRTVCTSSSFLSFFLPLQDSLLTFSLSSFFHRRSPSPRRSHPHPHPNARRLSLPPRPEHLREEVRLGE